MDKVRKSITCVECLDIIESPVLLPCSHSICVKHVRVDDKTSIKCAECGVEHQIPVNIGFPKNQALEYILESKISSIDFGRTHVQAMEYFDNAESLFKSMECLVNDPSTYSHEEINSLRNRVHIKSEELKLSVERFTENLLDKLKEYEKKCDNVLTDDRRLPVEQQKHFDKLKEKIQTKLTRWKNELNEIKFDEKRWAKIASEIQEMISLLNRSMESLKEILILKRSEREPYTSLVSNFEYNDILMR